MTFKIKVKSKTKYIYTLAGANRPDSWGGWELGKMHSVTFETRSNHRLGISQKLIMPSLCDDSSLWNAEGDKVVCSFL